MTFRLPSPTLEPWACPLRLATYAGFSDLAQQEADSRIFGGIHYRFDNEASQAYCVKAPEFAAEHFMLPRDR